MSLIEALLFGLLQGLTEFFPVSSSAHLKIAKILMHVQDVENQVLFDLACHLGTLVALLYFLRHEILQLFRYEQKKLFLFFVALIPLVPAYFLLKPLRDYASQSHLLGYFLILTALILFGGSHIRIKRTEDTTSKRKFKDAVLIGAMQSAALIPGISRSASTISCAQVLGWNAKEAVRFSFLLSIPTILGGNCLEILKMLTSSQAVISVSLSSCLVGFFASCAIGLAVIGFAMRLLEKGVLRPFAWYCLILGITVSIYLNFF